MIFFVAQSPNACLDKSKPRVIVQRRQLLRYGSSDTFTKNCVVNESVCVVHWYGARAHGYRPWGVRELLAVLEPFVDAHVHRIDIK